MRPHASVGAWLALLTTFSTVATAQGTDRRPSPSSTLRRSTSATTKGPARPSGTWIGQDGHDLVGPSSVQEPSGVQDIHIALRGLPNARAIEYGTIKGLGGDEWQINGSHGPWKAALVRPSDGPTADIYVEPSRAESGRPFSVYLRFAGGGVVEFDVRGGKADPQRRTTQAALAVRWAGQEGKDQVGLGPSVGPDGRIDVRLELARLSPKVAVNGVAVEAPGLLGWESGTNPRGRNNAELARRGDDPSRADLYFQADRDLSGVRLKVTVSYANGQADSAEVVGGRCDPARAMPLPAAVTARAITVAARWLGQDGKTAVGDGDIHATLSGLPRSPVVSATLSNASYTVWTWRADGSPPEDAVDFALPLAYRVGADPTTAELFFPPDRDESGSVMTLRLRLRGGEMVVASFPGGKADPALRVIGPRPERTEAKPGDDLHDLVNRFGTVHLAPGVYSLDRPLILDHPVTLSAAPGATLRFRQPADVPPWTAAIKIHCGRTTLDGFSVRFDGPVRWDRDVQFGPGVIASTDNKDSGDHPLKSGLVLRKLDLESPPNPGPIAEAPHLIRLNSALNGRIEGCTLKGGTTDVAHGPWQIVDNDYRGTVPNTIAATAFAVHQCHDVLIARNHVAPVGPSGKTWRFLVMTGCGTNDVIRENIVERIGPRDDDTLPDSNSAEVVLTESYHLRFEGVPARVSADGRILQIPPPQGGPAAAGDAVAILSGGGAGGWRRIAQPIGPQTYLMESPLPPGITAISIASGFVNETFADNRIDCRGSSSAANFVFVGNHFGSRISGNHLLGGGGWKLAACPAESPVTWGWSHAPFLGATVERNVLEDTSGSLIAVEHGAAAKSNRGRVYLSMTFKDNVARWTSSGWNRVGPKTPAVGFTIGSTDALDPAELVMSESGTRVDVPPSRAGKALRILSARVNEKQEIVRAGRGR